MYEVLKRNGFRGFSSSDLKSFSNQILACLSFLKANNIIHCDLKPENILMEDLNSKTIKIIDFGSSCFSNQRVYSYIQSRFYRAPEVVLGIPYTNSIDMWSFGCLLAELYTGLPIFPAEDEKELISSIVEIIGVPSLDYLKTGSRFKAFFSEDGAYKPYINKKGKQRVPKSRNLALILKGADKEMIKVVEECLQWDPKARISPDNALKSEWFLGHKTAQINRIQRRCKISMEDITKHTPKLQKFIADRKSIQDILK